MLPFPGSFVFSPSALVLSCGGTPMNSLVCHVVALWEEKLYEPCLQLDVAANTPDSVMQVSNRPQANIAASVVRRCKQGKYGSVEYSRALETKSRAERDYTTRR